MIALSGELCKGDVAPGMAAGGIERLEGVFPPAAGNTSRTQNFYGPITVQVSSSGASLAEELERILR